MTNTRDERRAALILAAGKGTRMKSDQPKVLCEVLFKPMLQWVIEACRGARIDSICAVTGYGAGMVEERLRSSGIEIETALQAEQLGTGHAVMCARDFLERHRGGDVVILGGDAPFIDPETIERSYGQHRREKNAITIITACPDDPTGYGRIVRGGSGVERIVEHKDATGEELRIREINSGAYWFAVDNLLEVLGELGNANAQGEYYLPDTIALTLEKGRKVGAYISDNADVVLGANSRLQLMQLNQIANRRVIERLMDEGVEFLSLDGILIAPDSKVGRGTVILPGTILRDGAEIGEDCMIGPNSLVSGTKIGDGSRFNSSQCYASEIGEGVSIGPFCHIRPNTRIKDHVHIGDFVEVKNAVIGDGTHIAHLTYVGDSDVGERVNFGGGSAIANYNGVTKSRSVIGDDVFLGCHTVLVSPVKVGDRAYTAAGSIITEEIPADALAIARERQVNKEGYNEKLRGAARRDAPRKER